MEEMNSTVLEVAKNAGGASDISNAAKHKAEVGSEIVSRAVTGIQEVQRQSQALKEGMQPVDKHYRLYRLFRDQPENASLHRRIL